MGGSLGSGPPSVQLMSWGRGFLAPGTFSWKASGWALWGGAPLLGQGSVRGVQRALLGAEASFTLREGSRG